MGPNGARNQKWLCRRRPAANYCSAQAWYRPWWGIFAFPEYHNLDNITVELPWVNPELLLHDLVPLQIMTNRIHSYWHWNLFIRTSWYSLQNKLHLRYCNMMPDMFRKIYPSVLFHRPARDKTCCFYAFDMPHEWSQSSKLDGGFDIYYSVPEFEPSSSVFRILDITFIASVLYHLNAAWGP
jgi:hypothetical protein